MYLPCAAQEFGFALLERDRIDHGLALRDLQTRREHLPFRGVDHRRHAGDFRLRGHQVEECAHGFDAVDHAVVHADVDDLRPRIDLRTGYRQGLFVIALGQIAHAEIILRLPIECFIHRFNFRCFLTRSKRQQKNYC